MWALLTQPVFCNSAARLALPLNIPAMVRSPGAENGDTDIVIAQCRWVLQRCNGILSGIGAFDLFYQRAWQA